MTKIIWGNAHPIRYTTRLELTKSELDNLYTLLSFHLESMDEDDDRYDATESLMNKIEA